MGRVNPARFNTALDVLEAARDDYSNLTDEEQLILNEAHTVLQEWDDRR